MEERQCRGGIRGSGGGSVEAVRRQQGAAA